MAHALCTPALEMPKPPTKAELFHFMKMCEQAMETAPEVSGELRMTFPHINATTSFRSYCQPLDSIRVICIADKAFYEMKVTKSGEGLSGVCNPCAKDDPYKTIGVTPKTYEQVKVLDALGIFM